MHKVSGEQFPGRALAVVVCAALSAKTIQEFVEIAQVAGWDVWIIATPNARSFIDEPLLCAQTGHAVTVFASHESEIRESPLVTLPSFDTIVVVPATFNTLRKWVQRQTDTLALILLQRWMDERIPIFVFPRASVELAQEPEFQPSLDWLRTHGIHVYYEPERFPPNNNVPWPLVLAELQRISSSMPY